MSDPRLDGDYTISTNSNVYGAAGSARYELLSGTWRIETEEGAWQASYTRVGFPDGYVSTVTTPLVGEGGYDGLFAVWEARYLGDAACAWDIRGVIFPAAPPQPPTAPLAAQSLTTPSPPASLAPAPSASMSVTEFNGQVVCGPAVRSETSTPSGDHQEFRGGAWSPTATEMSDPRLAGNYTVSSDTDVYRAPGSETYTLGSETWRIETQSGAWEASSTVVGFPDGSYSTATIALVGEGAWDGLVAIWEGHYLGDAACAWDVRGVTFPAGPPDPPTAS